MSDTSPESRGNRDVRGTIGALIFIAIGAAGWWDTTHILDPEADVFPRTVIICMVLFSALLILRNLLGVGAADEKPLPGSVARRTGLIVTLFLAAFLMPHLGFIVTGLLAYLAIMMVAMYERWTRLRKGLYPLVGVVIVYAFYFLFDVLFKVPLPQARLF